MSDNGAEVLAGGYHKNAITAGDTSTNPASSGAKIFIYKACR
jgi:hypothetical protein